MSTRISTECHHPQMVVDKHWSRLLQFKPWVGARESIWGGEVGETPDDEQQKESLFLMKAIQQEMYFFFKLCSTTEGD